MLDFYDSKKLVEDALEKFYPEYPWKYISDEDLDRFLREHPLVLVVSGEPSGLPIRKIRKIRR